MDTKEICQTNIEIPFQTVAGLKIIAINNRLSFKEVCNAAFEHFLSLKPAAVNAVLSTRKRKVSGRKLQPTV